MHLIAELHADEAAGLPEGAQGGGDDGHDDTGRWPGGAAVRVAPIYLAFAIVAPLIGWMIARLFRLNAPGGRAVAFSAGTRNSLVVLPLAFAVPDGLPLVPAVVVTQTLIELLSKLGYVRFIARLGRPQEGLADS